MSGQSALAVQIHTETDEEGWRRRHDLDAYTSAKIVASDAVRELLRALSASLPPAEMTTAARAALRSVGLLWETAARLSE